ncbi:MAG: hypothetical protein KTR31_21505 [Myxococcales bacterium]|nr:hypothetical protein [Myxococcales bacterium]
MDCELAGPLLDELVDGTLPRDQHAQVNGHVQRCDACTAELAAITRLIHLASELPPPPAPDQWNAVQADLSSRTPPRRWRPPSARRAVGVGLLVAAAAAALALLPEPAPVRPPPPPLARTGDVAEHPAPVAALDELEQASADLQATLLDDPQLDPVLRDELQQTLRVIDSAIADVARALRDAPRDGRLNRTLTRLKRRKLTVLAHTEVQLASMETP